MEELNLLTGRQGWSGLCAVEDNAVFIADYDLFNQPSAGTLVDGIQLLAALFNPGLFYVPAHLQHKYVNIKNVQTHV